MNPHLELTPDDHTLDLTITLNFQSYLLHLPDEETQYGVMVSGIKVTAPIDADTPLDHLHAAHKATAQGTNHLAAQIALAIEEVVRSKELDNTGTKG